MYKVLCDNALMCDSRIGELALLNPVVKLEENKAGSFSFKIQPKHLFYDIIKKRKSIVEVYRDEELIFSGMCIEVSDGFYKQKDIFCEGELSYFNDSIQRPARYQGVTVRGLLEAYINNHNAQVEESKHFQVGMVTVTDPNNYLYCYTNMESTMKALKEDLVDDLGGFFRVRHVDGVRYLDYLAESPNTNSQVIKLGKNLIDFKSNIDTTDIATAIIPLGAKLEESTVEGLETRLTIESINNGLDYVHSAEAVATYGWVYKTVLFDDVTTPENLKTKGEKYLAETQFENVVIEAKAIDLHITDSDIESFKVLDQIRVKSAPHGLNKYFRLTKQTLNLNNPEKDTITLGKSERGSLSAKSVQVSEEIRKAVESIVPPSDIVQQAVANATQLITNAMGGYVVKTNNELLIMDTPDIKTATKVWRWNINGLAYSSTGYNGKYALALTMDGRFVANAITVEGLEVGKNVRMGEDVNISWEQVDKANEMATKITKDTVTTEYVNALNVKAKNVDAENLTGEVIRGKKLLIETESLEEVNWIQILCGTEGDFRSVLVQSDRVLAVSEAHNSSVQMKGELFSGFADTELNDENQTFYIRPHNGEALFSGTLYTASGTVTQSDKAVKNSVEQLDTEKTAAFIYSLKPCKYKYNNGTSGRFHHGLIADDVKEAMDEDWGLYVESDRKKEGNKALRYEELTPDLIATVQSLNERVKKLEKGGDTNVEN